MAASVSLDFFARAFIHALLSLTFASAMLSCKHGAKAVVNTATLTAEKMLVAVKLGLIDLFTEYG